MEDCWLCRTRRGKDSEPYVGRSKPYLFIRQRLPGVNRKSSGQAKPAQNKRPFVAKPSRQSLRLCVCCLAKLPAGGSRFPSKDRRKIPWSVSGLLP